MNSILAPRSLFYGGDWHDAHWQSEVIDQETGEVALLGTVVDLGDGKRSPTVVVVRLTMELVRRLRPPAARQPAPIVQPPNEDGQPAISHHFVNRTDAVLSFSLWLRKEWPRCTPDEQRQTLRETAAQLETWADQMREEAADL